MERYIKQIKLDLLGEIGQEKLFKSNVLIVGCGGLGSPVVDYLSRAGIGKIGIIDYDKVEISNLHRQSIFFEKDVGVKKVISAKKYIKKINSKIKVDVYDESFSKKNASDLVSRYKIIVDCTDDLLTRYLICDITKKLNKIHVYAALHKNQGQLSVFNYQNGPNYRSIFPIFNESSNILNCNDVGVLGTLPGILGVLQANEVIKIILGHDEILSGKIMIIDLLKNEFKLLNITEKASNKSNDKTSFMSLNKNLISLDSIHNIKRKIFVDLRNLNEKPRINNKNVLTIPLDSIENKFNNISKNKNIIFFCASGKRSLLASQIIKKKFNVKTYSLNEGADKFKLWLNEK